MELIEFENEISKYNKQIGIELNNKQIRQLFNYMKLVIEWNEKINLTAITDEKEFIIKHIIDSLTLIPYINDNSELVDVGTGAGFPGIPLKIANPTLKITLLDSLNKRITFLKEVITHLELNDIIAVHSRAEDFGRAKENREKFDIAVARAVAPMNILIEYLIPLVKVKGECICMKSIKGEEEIKTAKKALEVLNGTIAKNVEICLLNTDIHRNIIIIRKEKETTNKYPRKAGMPSKQPIV